MVFVSLLAGCATLHIEHGLAGTERSEEGFTDKQLGMLRWLWNHTYVDPDGAEIDWSGYSPWTNQRREVTSARYPLSFTAYALASVAYEHIPAARAGPAKMLRNIFTRLAAPRIWKYWTEGSSCGQPWTIPCALTNASMCTLNKHLFQSDTECPDPMSRANIMYSGHVAHVGTLYEHFAEDPALSTKGWTLQDGDWSKHFTLPSLFEAFDKQAAETTAIGGGITCEPGMVYTACNSHHQSAYKLYDAIHNDSNHSNAIEAWRTFLHAHTNPEKAEWLFNVLLRKKNGEEWTGGIRGCASDDGWTLSWLPAWDRDSTALAKRGVANFVSKKNWMSTKKGQAFFNDDCWELGQRQKSWLATSWLLILATQVDVPGVVQRAQEVFNQFEEYGQMVMENGEPQQFFYDVDGQYPKHSHRDPKFSGQVMESMTATCNALWGMVGRNTTLQELYGSVDRLRGPSILVDWPRVLVRHAVWYGDEDMLRFTIVGDADIEIELDGRRFQSITHDGSTYSSKPCGRNVCISSNGSGDHKFEAKFFPKAGSTEAKQDAVLV